MIRSKVKADDNEGDEQNEWKRADSEVDCHNSMGRTVEYSPVNSENNEVEGAHVAQELENRLLSRLAMTFIQPIYNHKVRTL